VTAAKQRLESTTQKVLADLDDADQRRASAARRIELSERALALSKRQLEAARARFRTGTATALEAREAEEQLRTAELRAVRARVDLVLADYGLLHLSGGRVSRSAR
jgi:outer membrane protein TolC